MCRVRFRSPDGSPELLDADQVARGIADGAVEAGLDPARIHHVADDEDALEVLRPRLRDGDTLLVKASRGIGLDRVVDALRLELGEVAAP